MRTTFRVIATTVLLSVTAVSSFAAEIVAGPMLGYSTMREVAVWVQLDDAAEVQLEYWQKDSDQRQRSQPGQTLHAHGYTAKLIAEGLKPGQRYQYRLWIDGSAQSATYTQEFMTQPLWQWRDDPPAFSFALASCFYVNEKQYDRPGRPYGDGFEILDEIVDQKPQFMLWMGDNTYLREADWDSRFGIYDRHQHTRSFAPLQPLLPAIHHYATWDDHDYGPNNSDGAYAMKDVARQAFVDFWANPNWNTAGDGGISGTFEWHDVQFFLLDNRWVRTANNRVTGEPQVFGEQQIQWLINAMKGSYAPFKFVVTAGVFLDPTRDHEAHINLAPGERERLLSLIAKERIPGVIFLNGDIHRGQMVKHERPRHYPLYEWTVSPLTAGVYKPRQDTLKTWQDDSMLAERHFGMAEVSGPRTDRVLKLRQIDQHGKERWSTTIRARDLDYRED